MLEQAAREGHLRLKYLDETGFCLWSPLSYSWSLVGTQKCQEQTARRGRRLSLLGVWEPGVGLTYGLALGSMTPERYIHFMEAQARAAKRTWTRRGQITVVVQDNASCHTSRAVGACLPRWQAMGLYLFQLPAYSSELNPIEREWRQVKAYGLRGRMFEDEYDLAMAVIDAVRARGDKAHYRVDRWSFVSHHLIRSPLLST